jgi:hypothetical protein
MVLLSSNLLRPRQRLISHHPLIPLVVTENSPALATAGVSRYCGPSGTQGSRGVVTVSSPSSRVSDGAGERLGLDKRSPCAYKDNNI